MSTPTEFIEPLGAIEGRATSLVLRLLSGAGAASFVAYRQDGERSVDLLVHGLTTSGELVVAATASADLPGLSTGPVDVRVDIRREAAEPEIRVLAATAHLLGTIHWRSGADHLPDIGSDGLPERFAMLASTPGIAIGVVRWQRVLLHDMSGVTPFERDDLRAIRSPRAGFPGVEDELEAQDVIRTLDQPALAELHRAVVEGHCAGKVLGSRPVGGSPACIVGRVFCVDVDATGICLLHVGVEETTTVVVGFPEPVGDTAQLRRQVAALGPQSSVLTRYPRI